MSLEDSDVSRVPAKPELDEFDIWHLIKRSSSVDPYCLTAKYRAGAAKGFRKVHSTGGVISRRRKRVVSRAESEGQESSVNSHKTTSDQYDENQLPDDFDYDAEEDQLDSTFSNETHTQTLYLRACRDIHTHPTAYVYRNLNSDKIVMRHHNVGPKGAKAIAVALCGNSSVQSLDLADNDIGSRGCEYIADLLKENHFVNEIDLSENNIGVEGAKYIINVVKLHDKLTTLNLGGNGFRECDSEIFRPLLEDTHNLKHLNLSHNEFRELGGEVLGDALVDNDTLKTLDLSWNHLRRDGAIAIADGLGDNTCLTELNLAWNGFHMDGCRALARALEYNTTLLELDLTCNRINKECLEKLMGGLKKNTTLKILHLGWNPITPAGAGALLSFINDTKSLGLQKLDLTDQLVEKSFVALYDEMQAKRDITVVYGPVRGQENVSGEDDEKQLMDENPIIVLMEFGKLMGFRLMDLFAALDKDGSKSLDHDEIRNGLRMVNIPLSDKCIEILIQKLDVDGDGEIDFGELMAAQQEHRRKMSRFYAAQEGDVDIEDTEIGRVRIKLQRLMAKKMSGNPAFKRQSKMLLQAMGIDIEEETKPAGKSAIAEETETKDESTQE